MNTKPSAVCNLLEYSQRLTHAVSVGIFEQLRVVVRKRSNEYHRVGIVKALDPLATFTPLSAHVIQMICTRRNNECCLYNTKCPYTAVQNVIVSRLVISLRYAIKSIKKAVIKLQH